MCVRNTEADIIVLLDVQKNQSSFGFQYRKTAIRKLLEGLYNDNPNVQIGMVAYSDHADYVFKLSWSNNVHSRIAAAFQVELDKVSVESNLSHTLQFVGVDAFRSSNGGRPLARKIVVMFSSLFTGYSAEIRDQILNLNQSDIEVLGVATNHNEPISTNYTEILLDASQLLVIPKESHTDPFDCLKAVSGMTSYYVCNDSVFQLYP